MQTRTTKHNEGKRGRPESSNKKKIVIKDVPETVEVIEMDEYNSEEDLARGERDNAFKILKKTYPDEIRNFGVQLNDYISKVYHPTENMTPIDHFMIKQVTLAAYGICTRFKRERLGCDDCRDHFENLACLLEFVEQHNAPKSALELAHQLSKLITVCGRITSYLEDMSKKHVTSWDLVAKYYGTTYNTYRMPQRHAEFAPYIGYFTNCTLQAIGSFGTVHLAKLGSIEVAVKVVTKRKSRQNAVKSKNRKTSLSTAEIAYMIRHPLFAMVYSTFTTKEAYVSVMEFVKGTDCHRLYVLARYLPSNVVTILSAQLCLAIEYMHYLGFMHRDIKPSNMIITPRCRLKVCDYDTAKVCTGMYSARLMTGFLRRTIREFNDKENDGTVGYYSPELINRQPYGRAIDWWAIGVTIFTLRYGRLPFRATTEALLKQKINRGKLQFTYEDTDEANETAMPLSTFAKTAPRPKSATFDIPLTSKGFEPETSFKSARGTTVKAQPTQQTSSSESDKASESSSMPEGKNSPRPPPMSLSAPPMSLSEPPSSAPQLLAPPSSAPQPLAPPSSAPPSSAPPSEEASSTEKSPEPLKGGLPPCVVPSADNTEDLNKLISALMTVPANLRMCSKRYAEFREHAAFREINWDWLEESDDIYVYPLIEKLMCTRADGSVVPIATEARGAQRNDKSMAFELNKLTDIPKQPRLYVYMSEGFSYCATEVAYRREVKPLWIQTHPELTGKFQENIPYKFKDFFKGNRL